MNKKRQEQIKKLATYKAYNILHPVFTEGKKFSKLFSAQNAVGVYCVPFIDQAYIEFDEEDEETEENYISLPETEEEYKLYYNQIIKEISQKAQKALLAIWETLIIFFEDDPEKMPKIFLDYQNGHVELENFAVLPNMIKAMKCKMTNANIKEIREEIIKYFEAATMRDEEILTSIEDKNKNRQERWATVPKCIDAAIEAITLDRNTGFDRAKPPERETWRTNVQNTLRRTEKRVYKTTEGDYYQTADIAEAMKKHHPEGFEAYQYNNEFTRFAITGEDVQKKQIKTSKKSQKSESR